MLFIALFIVTLFVLLGIHVFYPLLLKRLPKKGGFALSNNQMELDSPSYLPMVSILIPVYNEESAIEKRINNILESRYPINKLEIIVIDSGSTDKTRSIVESCFEDTVVLITEEIRRGKAHAINTGLQFCRGDIVILTDGTTLYDEETISNLVNSFRDNRIGAATALYDVPNSEQSHVTASERIFWAHKDNLRVLESTTYSTSWLSGEACALRNKIIERVDEDTLADDSNIALQIISKGYKVVLNPNARFVERSPSQFSDYVKIKSRRALGGLIETLRFKSLLFNRKFGYFGTVIFPYRFFVCLLSPILSCLLIGLMVPAMVEIVSITRFFFPALLGVGLILSFILFRVLVLTFFYTQLITILALFWLLSGKRDVRWTRSKTR